jgi:hypothetical protein
MGPVGFDEATEEGEEEVEIWEVISRNCTAKDPVCNGQCENVMHRPGTRPSPIP